MKKAIVLMMVLALLLPLLAMAETVIDPNANRGINPQRGLPNNPAIPGESMTTGLPTDQPYIPILVNIDNAMLAPGLSGASGRRISSMKCLSMA